MQRSPSGFPLANYVLFIVLSIAVLWLGTRSGCRSGIHARQQPGQVAQADKQKQAKPGEKPPAKPPAKNRRRQKPPGKVAEKPSRRKGNRQKSRPAKVPAAIQAKEPPSWVALGSADDASLSHVGHLEQSRRRLGPHRTEQPPIPRPRRPRRIPGPRGHGRRQGGQRLSRAGRRPRHAGSQGRPEAGRPITAVNGKPIRSHPTWIGPCRRPSPGRASS